MSSPRFALIITIICIGLAGSASASAELLYVQEGHNLVTYSVNSATAVATKLSTLWMHADPIFGIQILRDPAGPYLYILGFTSPTQEYFWVHTLSSNGAPTVNPIQVLQVKPALTQFVFQNNGKFGYAEYSWIQPDSACNGPRYFADIVLYTVDPKTGLLTNTHKPVFNFPSSCSRISYLYGLNQKGDALYTYDYPAQGSFGGSSLIYSRSTVDSNTGSLGFPVIFWGDSVSPYSERSSFTDALIAQSYGQLGGSNAINVYPNAILPTNPIINCTSSMLQVCGDMIASSNTEAGLYFDPSGKYLFVLDLSINSTPIVSVNLGTKTLATTGSSLPGVVVPVFSHDGKMVYAIANNTVLLNVFNPLDGHIEANTSIVVPAGSHISAW